MPFLLQNNAGSTLASNITSGQTTLSIQGGDGSKFPSPTGADSFRATIVDSSGNFEIVDVTNVTVDAFTIVRNQESSGAKAFNAGDKIDLRITKEVLENFPQINKTNTFALLQTFNSGIAVTGDISVSGNVDGRDVSDDGDKLDGIESSATQDQTGAQIKTAYENVSDTNAFTDSLLAKLSGIESGATADQSAAQILAALLNADGSGSGLDADLLDGLQASVFLRTNASSIKTSGTLTLNDNIELRLGTSGGEGRLSSNGADSIFNLNGSNFNFTQGGDVEFQFQTNGDLHTEGDLYSFSTSISSDPKLKDDIELITSALDKIKVLNGITWNWKKNGMPSAGVLSTDVKMAMPDLITDSPMLNGKKCETYQSVNYNGLIGVLIEGMKEQQAQIEELQRRG